jgi:two-component system response regulator PilR (NtrC family)
VSATHKDLAADVQAARFRQDLFYRLNVIEILVPPLRDRREDLPALCQALLARIARETGLPPPQLSPQVLAQLQAHPLPGNVRELENLLHRALALSDGSELQVDLSPSTHGAPLVPAAGSEAPASVPAPAPAPASSVPEVAGVPSDLQAYLDQQEREILVKALRETNFNRTAAAQRLGLSLRQIRYRIARLGIPTPGNEDVDEASDA